MGYITLASWGDRHYHLAVIALTTVMFVVVVSHIGENSLWLGEGETWTWSRIPPFRSISAISSSFHPPGYYIALGAWINLFGDSEFSMRLPSSVMFALTIPIVYLVGKVAHSPKVGLIMALMIATSPYIFIYATESRSYMTLFFSATSMMCCMACLLRGSLTMPHIGSSIVPIFGGKQAIKHDLLWLGFIVFMVLAMFTHFVSIILPVISMSIFIVVTTIERKSSRHLIVNAIIAHALIFLIYINNPLGFYAYHNSPTSPDFDLNIMSYVNGVVLLLGAGHFPPAALISIGCIAVAAIQWYRNKNWKWLTFVLVGPLVIFAAAVVSELTVGSIFRARIFIWVIIPICLLLAVGLCSISKRSVFISLLGLLLSFNIYGIVMAYNTVSTPWDIITEDLVSRVHEDDGLIICPHWAGFGIKPYYDGPKISKYGMEGSFRIYPEGHTQHDRLWIIISHAHKCSIDILNDRMKLWDKEIYRNRIDYGTPWPSVLLGDFLRNNGLSGTTTGEKIGGRGYIILYGLER